MSVEQAPYSRYGGPERTTYVLRVCLTILYFGGRLTRFSALQVSKTTTYDLTKANSQTDSERIWMRSAMYRVATFAFVSWVFLGAAAHAQTGQTPFVPQPVPMAQGAQTPYIQAPAVQAPGVTNPTIMAPPVSAQPSPPPFPNAEPPGYTPPGVASPQAAPGPAPAPTQ
jgi:hypothetical protein